MKILVTNDDGVLSEGLWVLVRELTEIANVTVVAPDKEQSAIGTAVTLRQPVRMQKVKPIIPEVETYAVEGTPSDSVILALGKLIPGGVDLVISGINHGMNLGEDVHISGTVGAALQGYLRGFTSLAISAPFGNSQARDVAARVATILAGKITGDSLPKGIFLNVNMPDMPLVNINGVKITRLSIGSHINTVEEGNDGNKEYYWLIRQRANTVSKQETDIWAIEQGNNSITPLYLKRSDKPSLSILNNMCSDILHELRK